MKNKFLVALLVIAMTLSLAACGGKNTDSSGSANGGSTADAQTPSGGDSAPANAVTWKFATNTLEDTETAKVYEKMIQAVYDATNGEVTIDPYYASALGAEADVIQNVQTGNIEMGHFSFAMLSNFETAWNVMDLPFMFDSKEHFQRYLETDEAQELMSRFEQYGIWFDYCGIQGYRQTNMVDKCLTSVEDYKGQTIRVMDNAVQLGTLEALNAIPITVPYSDVYNALKTGVCDGWTAIYTGMNETSSCEVAPYVTEVPMFACVTGIAISTKALEKLSPESAEAVKEVYREYMPQVLESMYTEDIAYRDQFVKEGLIKEVYTVEDTTAFIDAVSPVWTDVASQYEGVQEQIDVINSVR